ncbi:MAG: LysR family transcriptional regulator [Steroidobacteraceae bacterium]
MGNGFPKTAVLNIDWNDLKYFLAVARSGSLTAAAQTLDSSTSTVSRHIDALEQRMGVKLFLRTQSGYLLSDAGQDILEPVSAIEQSMLAVERRNDASALNSELRGKVRLATSDGLAAYLVAPHLQQFWQRHPQVQVELLTSVAIVDLNRREADLALRFVNPAEQLNAQDYIALNLGAVQFGAYCASKVLPGSSLEVREAAQQLDFISWNESWSSLPMMEWLPNLFGNKVPLLTTNNLLVQHQAARAGLGIALLPDYMGDDDPLLCRLILPENINAQRALWLVYHRDLKNSQRVIAMRDFLKDLVGQRLSKQQQP